MKAITQASLGTISYAFKVFHQSYIQENISQDMVKHIFTVRKEQAEKLAEAKRLRAAAVQQDAVVKKVAAEHTELLREFDRLKNAKARTIKDAANYSNAYNKNKYYEAHRALSKKTILTDEMYQKATAAMILDSRPHILPVNCRKPRSSLFSILSRSISFFSFWCGGCPSFRGLPLYFGLHLRSLTSFRHPLQL